MSKRTHFTQYTVGAALLASAIGLGVFGIATASRDAGLDHEHRVESEYDEDHESDDHDLENRYKASLEASPYGGTELDAVYQEECGSCHMAYPPRLLPSASWKVIMSTLTDHFGDNAELPADLNAHIMEFLDRNASDRGDRMKNARLLRDTKGAALMRITELPYFKDEHDEIPRRMVEDNPKVESFSRCDGCHRDAAKARFDEDTVAIPGFGRWDH